MAKHISEKQEEILMEKLLSRVEDANTAFLINIGKRIKKIKNLNKNEANQLTQILKYGGDYEKIINEVAKYADKNVDDINELFSEYAKKDQEFYKQFYEYRDVPYIPYEQNITLQRQTQALANVVKNEMYDFTRANVLGYTIRDNDGNPQFLGLRDTYNRVLDEAFLNVGMGKETFDTAMSRILKEIGGSGLKTVEFESGRSMRLDSAIRMHLGTRLKELHNENEQVFGEEFNADGVEISVHSNPADDHAEAQGRQFTNEQFELLQTTGTAEDINGNVIDMHRVTKKGVSYSFRPISEMNCRHYIFSIVVGVSEPEYTDEQLEAIEYNNNIGFTYEGEHYTNYEGTQLQRKLETEIRKQKDMQVLAKASDNNTLLSEAQSKIKTLTQKYKELCAVSGLQSKMDRLRVSGYKRAAVKVKTDSKNTTNNEKIVYKDYYAEANKLQTDDKRYEAVLEIGNMFDNKYEPIYNKLNEEEKEALHKYAGLHYKNINKVLLGLDLGDTDAYVGVNGVKNANEYKTKIKSWVKNIDKAIGSAQLEENTVLWRGTLESYYKKYKPGDTFEFNMYNSTSLNRNIAETFTWNKEEAVVLKINCRAGTNAMYMDIFGYGEQEMLLGRKQKYKYIRTYEDTSTSSVLKGKKVKIIELEAIK